MSMKKNDPIKHVMTTELQTLSMNSTFSDAKNLMQKEKVHHLPVLDGKTLKGMVSRIDILKYSFSNAFNKDEKAQDVTLDHTINLQEMMTTNLVTINEDTTVRDAAEILAEKYFNSLPVVNKSHELVGMITSKDIVHYLLEQY